MPPNVRFLCPAADRPVWTRLAVSLTDVVLEGEGASLTGTGGGPIALCDFPEV